MYDHISPSHGPKGRVYSPLIYTVGSKARNGPESTARRRQDPHPVLEQNLQLGFWVSGHAIPVSQTGLRHATWLSWAAQSTGPWAPHTNPSSSRGELQPHRATPSTTTGHVARKGDSGGLSVTGVAICQVLPHTRTDPILGLHGSLLLIPISYTGLPGAKGFTHRLVLRHDEKETHMHCTQSAGAKF